jgi:DNA-directed RNA polymerase subunit H (RpoH/RPB5)
VDEQTKIASRMEGAEKALKLPDLQAGDRVIVKYTASAGKNIAESIEVLRRDPTSSN